MIAEAKRDLYLQRELENPKERRLPILDILSRDEFLLLSSFFELLASWDTREKSNVR
jgi:hypothetical protein